MEKIKLDLPETWSRNVARRFGNRGYIAATAFNPYCFAVGVEVLGGYGKGLAIMVGPFWLAFAVGPKIN